MFTKLVLTFSAIAYASTTLGYCDPSHRFQFCHVPSNDHDKAMTKCTDYNGIVNSGHFGPKGHVEHSEDYLGPCVDSGMDEAWLCNAGLKHEVHSTEHEVCYGSSCMSTIDTNHNFETLSFLTEEYIGVEADYNFQRSSVNASSTTDFNTASSQLGSNILDDVQFILNSERLGSEYFVDICWKNKENNSDSVLMDFSSSLSAYTEGNLSYIDMTNLETRYELSCSRENSFSQLTPFRNFGGYSSLDPNFPFSTLSVNLDNQVTECVIRQYFKEARDIPGRVQRLNKVKTIKVNSNISTNVEETPPASDATINLCVADTFLNLCVSKTLDTDELRDFIWENHSRPGAPKYKVDLGLCTRTFPKNNGKCD